MARFSALEKALASAVGLDIISPGTSRKAAMAAVRAIPPLARGTGRVAGAAATRTVFPATLGAARAAGTLARRHPVALGAGLAYGAHRRGYFDPAYDVLREAHEAGAADVREALMESELQRQYEMAGSPDIVPLVKKRVQTKFNKAVKAGMAAVRKSTSNGKPGKITKPRAALAMVSKVISAKKKKRKAPKSGIRKKVYSAIRRFY